MDRKTTYSVLAFLGGIFLLSSSLFISLGRTLLNLQTITVHIFSLSINNSDIYDVLFLATTNILVIGIEINLIEKIQKHPRT